LAHIVKTAKQHHRKVCVCGEVAHQKNFLPFLVGIGVQRLSIDPQFLPEIQNEIGRINAKQAEAYATQLLTVSTLSGMKKHLASVSKLFS
jgi:phosphotransferase system enzyme I (PtsP)